MRQIELNKFSVNEKLDWLIDWIGEYDTLDEILRNLKEGCLFERLIADAAQYVDEEDLPTGDWTAWYLEGNSVSDALMAFANWGYNVEPIVDELVCQHELNIQHEDDECLSDMRAYVAQ